MISPRLLWATPTASSIPCRAMFASSGLITPPCGVPASVGVKDSPINVTGPQPQPDQLPSGSRPNGVEQVFVIDVVERSFDVGVDHPFLPTCRKRHLVYPPDGVLRTSAWTEPVACSLELSFPARLKGVLDHALKGTIANRWDSERTLSAIGPSFGGGRSYPLGWSGPPGLQDSQ